MEKRKKSTCPWNTTTSFSIPAKRVAYIKECSEFFTKQLDKKKSIPIHNRLIQPSAVDDSSLKSQLVYAPMETTNVSHKHPLLQLDCSTCEEKKLTEYRYMYWSHNPHSYSIHCLKCSDEYNENMKKESELKTDIHLNNPL